jgi:hypothetical protein
MAEELTFAPYAREVSPRLEQLHRADAHGARDALTLRRVDAACERPVAAAADRANKNMAVRVNVLCGWMHFNRSLFELDRSCLLIMPPASALIVQALPCHFH